VTDVTATIVNPTIVIKTINATIALDTMTMTQRAPSLTTRRMIASATTPKKRAMRPCTMTSPLCQAWATCPEEGAVLIQISFALWFLVLLLLKQQEL
jgi:hypothetical protein